MEIETSDRLSTKLFAGFPLNSEIRMHLNQSIHWKHATLLTQGLQEIHYRGKEYLGHYLTTNKLTIKELELIQSSAKKQLNAYCPSLETENIVICIFPQVLIA